MPIASASFVRDSASGRLKYASNVMANRLAYLNDARNRKSLGTQNDYANDWWYVSAMGQPGHDWYLKEWLATLGKRQSDIVRDLDWNKAKVSLTASGKQPYSRDDVNELADYLSIRPYELLMHPDDAMRLRRLKADAIQLAHTAGEAEQDSPVKSHNDRPRSAA